MVPIERTTESERRALAAAIERDFLELLKLLDRHTNRELDGALDPIKAKAEKGLKLAKMIIRELEANDNDPAS
jgi:hypothetical protein